MPITKKQKIKPAGNASPDQTTTPRMGVVAQKWAPLALADGKLLIRDQTRLLCVKVAK